MLSIWRRGCRDDGDSWNVAAVVQIAEKNLRSCGAGSPSIWWGIRHRWSNSPPWRRSPRGWDCTICLPPDWPLRLPCSTTFFGMSAGHGRDRAGQDKPGRWKRLLRFQITNGALSLGGNLVLMQVLVGMCGHELHTCQRCVHYPLLHPEFPGQRPLGFFVTPPSLVRTGIMSVPEKSPLLPPLTAFILPVLPCRNILFLGKRLRRRVGIA